MKKQPFIIFLFKKQRIYHCFYEFASEALHIVIFEKFVKSMTSCLSKLKVTPSFCFPIKIPDGPTATNMYSLTNHNQSNKKVLEDSKFGFLFFQLVDLSRIQPTFTTKMTLISASKFVSQVKILFIIRKKIRIHFFFVKSCSEQHTGVVILYLVKNLEGRCFHIRMKFCIAG